MTGDDPLVKLHSRITVSPAELATALAGVVKAVAQFKSMPVPAGLESLEPCAASKSIAESLLAGEKHAIFLGNVAEQSAQAAQLHSLAADLARLTGASFGFIGEAANSVGGYLAQALPTALNAYEMFAQPRKAYILLGIEPELDCYNPHQAVAALKEAALVVMLTSFKHDAALEYADVLLPVAPFAETSGSYVNTEGRLQCFSGVCRPLGDTRPAWKVMRVLGNVLAVQGFDYESSEQIRDEIVSPGSVFVAGLDNGISDNPFTPSRNSNGLQRIADVPIYFADPLVRRGVALQLTRDAAVPSARMCAATLTQLGIADASHVRVRQGQGETQLIARLDETVPMGCVRVAAAHASTAGLGDMFGTINVERA